MKFGSHLIYHALLPWRLFQCQLSRFHLRELRMGVGARFHVRLALQGQGTVQIGVHNHFGFRLSPCFGNGQIVIQPRTGTSRVSIGNNNRLSNNVFIAALESVSVGNRCLIGDGVFVVDSDFHELSPESRFSGCGSVRPVSIGDNVWIGSRAMILKGVEIGDGAVVGAGSVVTKSVPPRAVVAGNPARVLRML